MDKTNSIKLAIVGMGACLSAKLGILFPVLIILLGAMITDYVTGMVSAGYRHEIQSRRGMWGIVKKCMYGVAVAVAMMTDWIIINVADKVGVDIPLTTFFGLLVAIWLIFNEFVSILENLIKMEVPLPNFLINFTKYFKAAVEKQGESMVGTINSIKQE